jgi:hypothetical protein
LPRPRSAGGFFVQLSQIDSSAETMYFCLRRQTWGNNMKKNLRLKMLNALLGLLMVSQALSGLLHDRLSEETFEHIHILGGLLIVVGTVLHIILNWGWVKANYFKN